MISELNIQRIDTRQQDVRQGLEELRRRLSPHGNVVTDAGRRRTQEVFGEPLTPSEVAAKICSDVRDKGLTAVLDYSARIDRAKLMPSTIRVPVEELAEAHRDAEPEFLATIRRIRANIFEFQSALLCRDVTIERPDGSRLSHRYQPLSRVGICVPGGTAAYPSTVLMTAVPAQAAGVKQLAVVAPPTRYGSYNLDLLATCHELGITEVYRLGGPQAVAALAYGVEGLPRVDKIVGPGNLFVSLAKKFVYGEVDIDSIAGPSEVVVIADETARPDFTAMDLIAQAEHAPGASILISWNEDFLDRTAAELSVRLAGLDRGDLARESLEQFGAMIFVRSPEEAAALAAEIAPEHLHLAVKNPEELLKGIPTAGAVFMGNYTPVALGDYVAGPSHVLPTGGTARFASGLSANQFLRSHSVVSYTKQALVGVADDLRCLADKEGLTAHRASVDIRVD